MRILIILLIFLLINGCSNQNLSSVFKKNNDMSEKTNLNIDKNISFEDFKNNIINYGKNSSIPSLDD